MQEETMKQAGGGQGGDRVDGLKAKVDSLARLAQELDEARASAKRTRVGIVVGILLVVAIFVLVFARMVKNFDQAKFVGQVQARLMTPDARTIELGQKAVREVVPVYLNEAQKQFGEVWPDLQKKLQDEGQKYLDNISVKVEEHIKGELDALAKQQEAKIVEAFPQLKDEKGRAIVMDNLEKALRGATLDVMKSRVDAAEKKIWDVYEEMLKFVPPEGRDTFQARWAKAWEQALLFKGVDYY